MLISVIIPTYNRSALLRDTLASLKNVNYPVEKYEILVIDNNSIDDTKQIVDEFQINCKNCFYFKEDRIGLHNGRHCGIKNAKGDILAFIDDDVIVEPTWLKGVAKGFSIGDEVVLVGGNDQPKFDSELPSWFQLLWKSNVDGNFISEYSLLELGNELKEISPFMVYGCNFSIKKNFVLDSGGFHPDGFPTDLLKFRGDGESYLSNEIKKKNLKAIFVPEASLFHRVEPNRLSVEYLKKRSYMQGISHSYCKIREMKNLNIFKRIKIRSEIFFGNFRSKFIKTEPFKSMRQSFFKGFLYHYNQVKKDPELLEWVLKENYLD